MMNRLKANQVKPDQRGGHAGHGWLMMICCIPMLVIAVVLVATGIASIGFIFAAVLCTAMMMSTIGGVGRNGGERK